MQEVLGHRPHPAARRPGHTDYHYGLAWPSGLTKSDPTRLNTEWEAQNASGRTAGSVGNAGVVRYSWDDPGDGDNDGSHTFYSVVIFATCDNSQCGWSTTHTS